MTGQGYAKGKLHSAGNTVFKIDAGEVFIRAAAEVLQVKVEVGSMAGERRGKIRIDGLTVMGVRRTAEGNTPGTENQQSANPA
jgi:excinuclease UvrABC ATPase subunit